MIKNQNEIHKIFGKKLRVRVSGICINDESILLVKHEGLGDAGYIWSPPGGGMNYEENVEECLKREFKEETGLSVEAKQFLFVNEYYKDPLHAIELFFQVNIINGTLQQGTDPELSLKTQIISHVKYFKFEELDQEPISTLHNIFTFCKNSKNIINLRGYYYYNK